MPHIPLIGRLSPWEYLSIVIGFFVLGVESALTFVILFLPSPIIRWFHDRSRSLFLKFVGRSNRSTPSEEKLISERIRKAGDFTELCDIWGYTPEEHVVMTKDGYLLCLHRLPAKRGERATAPGTSTGKPVVYMHHGLLMNSEIWVCLTDAERCLPFVLVEQGYDVWLGNNRGNKYSKKHVEHGPNTTKFWNFSMDDFAWHDIPESIEYVLDVTKAPNLSYIGFSQGTAQAFAALSIHPPLNQKVNVFIALAPAMNPRGLTAPIVDGLMKASPTLMFLFFGRKAILPSTIMWQSILYPPIFIRVIDTSLSFLFNWHGANISTLQKLAAYSHLYSYASVKSVVHWFQIMRNQVFLMYDDDLQSPLALGASGAAGAAGGAGSGSHGVTAYRPARFPTKNIATPIVLMYGTSDSLVDINVMLRELPSATETHALHGYEHVDVLWGRDVAEDVVPHVLATLEKHCGGQTSPQSQEKTNGATTDRSYAAVASSD